MRASRRSILVWNWRDWTALPILAVSVSMAFGQVNPMCPVTTDGATYPATPLTYPMTSDRYSVQYQLGNSGTWLPAQVYISYYGGTNASPYLQASGYAADESMSFVSIPARASTVVAVRVTKIWGANFPAIGQMSVRPKAKAIQISSVSASTVQLSTTTSAGFAGDQFVLWWNGDSQHSSAIESLALYLDPPYTRPTGSNVKTIAAPADLTGDLSHFDTLDFEGTVAIGTTGAQVFVVPVNINNIFLGYGAWVQGKFQFAQSGLGNVRRIYGPGVLDNSRFGYQWRQCDTTGPHAADAYSALSWIALTDPTAVSDSFVLDGPVITDLNHFGNDQMGHSSVNNVKILSWNSENAALKLGQSNTVSNVFIRVGDDSLMLWDSYITVTNATVWQGWNGGVVNVGWGDDLHGDDCLVDGLYVVKTDWSLPAAPSWSSTGLNADNDAVIDSMMTPSATYGSLLPSVFRNIYVEDPPRALLSLKINTVGCQLLPSKTCAGLGQPSLLNLNLDNVFSPVSSQPNSIGFQTETPPLTGSMNIGFSNVMITQANGVVTPLTSANAFSPTVGNIATNGGNINLVFPPTPTVMTLSASPNPVAGGQTVTLTASVSPAAATGSVSFYDIDNHTPKLLGTGALSSGVATVTIRFQAGSRMLAASYSGDSNYGGNAAAAVNLTINPGPTTTTLSTAPAAPIAGQTVTLTATVTPSAATGTVTFQDGGQPIGSAPLSAGTASVALTTLAAGNYTLTASYGGDSSDAPSTSALVPLTVSPGYTPPAETAPRAPHGIYAVVDIENDINQQESGGSTPSTAQLDAYFNGLYQTLLQDPAVAGLALQVRWGRLNPTASGPYFWNFVDDAFQQVAIWNGQNPTLPPKTIQLIVTPGFQTPPWLLQTIPACDGLFASPVQTPPSNCGTVVFTGYDEAGDGTVLPLPWNPAYKTAWQTFLTALAARYGSNPAFVSIAVAGPTAASAEITTASNSTVNAGYNPQPQNGLAPNDMWRQLLAFQYSDAAHHNSDQAFIDEWENAINMYGQVFSGITLVVTTGSGLPNFNQNFQPPPAPYTLECPNPGMQCAAVATILSYFAGPGVGGANAKATQTSGMQAARAVTAGNIGIAGVKCMSQFTAQSTTPATQILGGAQFDTSFSNSSVEEGCFANFPPDSTDTPAGCNLNGCTADACVPVNCIPQACLAPGVTYSQLASYSTFHDLQNKDPGALIPPEQAEYNVMNVFFQGSPAAPLFGGTAANPTCALPGSPASAPLNYLQIYAPDIQYAQANVSVPAQVLQIGGAAMSVTAQQLLNLASQALGQTLELPLSVAPASLSITKTHTGSFRQGQQGASYTVTVSNGVSSVTTSSTVTVAEILPTGLTLVSMSGTGWNCSGNACFRGDGLNPGASYPAITVTVNVATNAPSQVTNQAAVSGGGSAGVTVSDLTAINAGQPPAAVATLAPLQGATGVSTTASLTWGGASGATSYNVYFGTVANPPLAMSGITGTSYSPAMLAGTTYYWSVTAVNAFGATPSTVWSFTTGAQTTSGFRLVPVTPCRVMDTRGPTGPFGGPSIAGGTIRTIAIPQSVCNIPATAQAYSLNITVVPSGPLGYLSIWPAGQPQPVVSTLNSYDGRIVANAAIVPAGSSGAISVYVSNTTDVIVDINGYFAPAATSGSLSFYTAAACRVMDTRNAAGPFGGPFLSGGSTRSFAIPSSNCGIPATAQAYSLNITVVPHGPLGYLTTWPAGQSQPLVSTLNAQNGSIVANAAIVPAGTSGAISVFVTNDTDVIIDINGYFAPASGVTALSLYTLTPCRVADTRGATGGFGGPSLPANGTRSFAISSSSCGVPAAQAYSLNVTVVPPGPLIYLTAWPAGQTQPVVSTLNSPLGEIVANAAIVPAGAGNGVSIFVYNATDVILDINAYFAQ